MLGEGKWSVDIVWFPSGCGCVDGCVVACGGCGGCGGCGCGLSDFVRALCCRTRSHHKDEEQHKEDHQTDTVVCTVCCCLELDCCYK